MLAAERGIELRWVPLTDRRPARPHRPPRAARRRQGVRLHGDEQRARHHHAGSSAVRRRARRRRARDRRRLPVRAAQRHRRAGVGRRLRRLQQPQDVRPVRHRRAVGSRGAARRDAAVPRWRQHDRSTSASTGSRRPSCRRSSKPARRRSSRPSGCGAAVDFLEGLGMANVRRHEMEIAELRDDARSPSGTATTSPSTARPTSRSAARRSASRSATSTRTTCRRCSTSATCASAPATTAPSR